jgi:hypothetical protein
MTSQQQSETNMPTSPNCGTKYKVTTWVEVTDLDELIAEAREYAVRSGFFIDAASAAGGISTVEDALCWVVSPIDGPGFTALDCDAEAIVEPVT